MECDMRELGRTQQRNNQTMSDTPRTDEREARSEGLHDEWAFTLCRQLERELNEARDRQWANSIHSCHNECARPMCVLRRERDEATDRLNHAEILLSDLASSYWRSVLNEQDPSGEGLMGERVMQYWARYCEQESTTKS